MTAPFSYIHASHIPDIGGATKNIHAQLHSLFHQKFLRAIFALYAPCSNASSASAPTSHWTLKMVAMFDKQLFFLPQCVINLKYCPCFYLEHNTQSPEILVKVLGFRWRFQPVTSREQSRGASPCRKRLIPESCCYQFIIPLQTPQAHGKAPTARE